MTSRPIAARLGLGAILLAATVGVVPPAPAAAAVNTPPVAVDDPGAACQTPGVFGGAFPIPEDWPDPFLFSGSCGLLANDTDADADPLTWAAQTLPAHGTLIKVDETQFTYQPEADWSTIAGDQPGGDWVSDSFTYVANDGLADSSPATMRFWIAPINDPPSFTPGPATVEVDEDSGAYSGQWASAGSISPGPANEAWQTVAFEIVNIDTGGVPNLFSVAPAISPTGVLTFTPAPGQAGLATVTVRAVDDGGLEDYGVVHPGLPVPDDTSPDASFDVVVNPVPDAPVAADANVVAVVDVPLDIDLAATDQDGDALLFVPGDPAHGALTIGATTCVAGDCAETVTYTPTAGYLGSDSFTFFATDGTLDSNLATVSITVEPPNNAPTGTDATIGLLEDGSHAFAAGDFGFGDPDDSPADGMAAVKVTTLPGAGALTADGSPVAAGDLVPVADLAAGKLVYTPAADANGAAYASFTFQVQDDGGTVAGGVDLDPSPNTITLDVASVNDAPSFTPGTDPTAAEDGGAYSAPWASAMSPGPANEGTQTITFVVTGNDNTALFSSQPAVATDGTLSFTPAPNRNGTASVTLHALDTGGTASGGDDTSGDVSLTITVTPVNDAPNAVNDTTFTVPENATAQTLDVLANDSSLPDAPEALVIVSVTAAGHGTVTKAVDGTSVTYTPSPMYWGTDTFTYTIEDPDGLTDTATVVLSVAKDVTKPTVSGVAQRIRTAVTMTSTSLQGRLTWTGSDAGVGIDHYTIQRSVNGGTSYTTLALTSATSYNVTYTFGSTKYRFRVRAVDRNGNIGAWVYTPVFGDTRSQETSGYVTYSGTWGTTYNANHSGGATRYASTAGKSATYRRTMRDVAFVAPKSSTRGSADIYVDGLKVATVSLKSSTGVYRQVLWTTHFSTLASHTIRVVVVGNGRVDVDCFVVLY